jgi:thiol-disulfide isomerase/thioredoxin
MATTSRRRARGAVPQARRWWRFALGGTAAALIVAVLVAVALVRGRGDGETESTPVAAATGSGASGAVHLAVPDIRLTAASFQGGRRFVLSENAHKPTVLFAMAAWCLTCIPEAKALVQLERELGDRVNIVVLDVDPGDTEQMLEQFARAVGGAPGVWALDRGGAVTRAYNIRSLDTTIVISGGREVARTFGPQSLEQLRAALARAQQAGR